MWGGCARESGPGLLHGGLHRMQRGLFNLNLKGKIAFFPLMAVSENGTRLSNMGAFDEATKLWDEEIDMGDKGSSASTRAPTHISDIMINIVDQLEASGHIHGSCLLPMHYLVSLLGGGVPRPSSSGTR